MAQQARSMNGYDCELWRRGTKLPADVAKRLESVQ